MRKINVLQVCNQLGIGGVEKALQLFFEHLDKDVFNVYVCGVYAGGVRGEILRNKGYEVYVVNGDKNALIGLMKEKKVDLIHVHRSGREPLVIEAAKQANVPVIVETNVFGHYDDSRTGRMINFHLLISKTVALRYMKNGKLSPIDFLRVGRVLYYPLDLTMYERYRRSKESLRDRLGISKDSPLIARVGRPDITKWSKFVIDVMKELVKHTPNVRYLMVGGIPHQIKSKIERVGLADHFISLDLISDEQKLIEIYRSIDVLAQFSTGETFGYAIAEAMATKKPVVVNSTPWIGYNSQIELVDHGKTGFVVNTVRTGCEALKYLIENKRDAEKMGLAGYEKVKKEYNIEKTVRVLEKIYTSLLVKKHVIDRDFIKRYEDVELHPTNQEIIDYSREYEMRLSNLFGKSSFMERLAYNWRFLSEYAYLYWRLYIKPKLMGRPSFG